MNSTTTTGITYKPIDKSDSIRVLLDGKVTGTIHNGHSLGWQYRPRTAGKWARGDYYPTLDECKRSLETDDTPAPTTVREASERDEWYLKDGKGVFLGSSGNKDSIFICSRATTWLAELPAGKESEQIAHQIVREHNSWQQLRQACEAALRYDAAIKGHAWKGESYVQDDSLDSLYADWIDKARTALRVAEGERCR